ncbi:MAG TPA: pyridoxamine 5'-phosphate oxidase family protein [Acidimicrobiia bacterium]|nr:pyridoxamine 5'-phosphate oxidase family protein [Acidimicrobiia bacterium]
MNSELDDRFSEPDATAVPWAQTRQVLADAQLAWITTVRADGRPHVTPLVTVWLDDALHFCTGPDEQKARNLAANANVVLTTGCNQWDEGLDVVVEGEAVRVTDASMLERLALAWAGKWDGRWTYTAVEGGFAHAIGAVDGAVDHGPVHVYSVRASKMLAFGKDPFSQTRYS